MNHYPLMLPHIMELSPKMLQLAEMIHQSAESSANSFLQILAMSGAEPMRRARTAESTMETTHARSERLSRIAELVDIFERSHWLDFILVKWPCWVAIQWLDRFQNRKNSPQTPK